MQQARWLFQLLVLDGASSLAPLAIVCTLRQMELDLITLPYTVVVVVVTCTINLLHSNSTHKHPLQSTKTLQVAKASLISHASILC